LELKKLKINGHLEIIPYPVIIGKILCFEIKHNKTERKYIKFVDFLKVLNTKKDLLKESKKLERHKEKNGHDEKR